MGGDESNMNVVYGKFQMGFCWLSDGSQIYPGGRRPHRRGWNIKPEVISALCTEFSEFLFEARTKIQLTRESLVSTQK